MPHRLLLNALLATTLLAGSAGALAPPQKTAPSSQPAGPQPILRATFLAQMDAQFGKMDGDKNGYVTRAEIEQFEKEKALAEAEARNAAWFDRLDVNKNGQLSAKEFAKMVAEPKAASAQPMLTREDGNRDGQISLVEHRASTLANFDRVDVDKDGVVSLVEMKAGGIAPR